MISMKPAKAKNFFFDRVLVTQYIDRKTASALAKGGGLIRRIVAWTSIESTFTDTIAILGQAWTTTKRL